MVPFLLHQVERGFRADSAVVEVGVLGSRVIAPDDYLADVAVEAVGAIRQLRDGAVVVEPGHRADIARVEIRGVVGEDARVGIRWIADHYDLATLIGLIQSAALFGENPAVGLEQVGPFHVGGARSGADQESVIYTLESCFGLGVSFYRVQ